ncbi:ureidoglycolate lyase [Pelagibius sp. CAU 1746]|uniref:ureidoglycolate lyase n=1 Tax=Pelagibius sp. CAU 1746 TaxID=3140370 RepID=UPI00325B0220
MILSAAPVDPVSFQPFGQVLTISGSADKRLETFVTPELVDHDRPLNVAYGTKDASSFPHRIPIFERHGLSTQLFVPVKLSRYLVIACPSGADGRPDLKSVGAFFADETQAIRFGRGVWHAPLCLADQRGSYLAVRYCRSLEDDQEIFSLTEDLRISLPPKSAS